MKKIKFNIKYIYLLFFLFMLVSNFLKNYTYFDDGILENTLKRKFFLKFTRSKKLDNL